MRNKENEIVSYLWKFVASSHKIYVISLTTMRHTQCLAKIHSPKCQSISCTQCVLHTYPLFITLFVCKLKFFSKIHICIAIGFNCYHIGNISSKQHRRAGIYFIRCICVSCFVYIHTYFIKIVNNFFVCDAK